MPSLKNVDSIHEFMNHHICGKKNPIVVICGIWPFAKCIQIHYTSLTLYQGMSVLHWIDTKQPWWPYILDHVLVKHLFRISFLILIGLSGFIK